MSEHTPPESKAKALVGYTFLVALANDRRIDLKELQLMEKLALEDNVIDEEERKVLKSIFKRVSSQEVADQVTEEMERFKKQYHID